MPALGAGQSIAKGVWIPYLAPYSPYLYTIAAPHPVLRIVVAVCILSVWQLQTDASVLVYCLLSDQLGYRRQPRFTEQRRRHLVCSAFPSTFQFQILPIIVSTPNVGRGCGLNPLQICSQSRDVTGPQLTPLLPSFLAGSSWCRRSTFL